MKVLHAELLTYLEQYANPKKAAKEKAYLYSDLKHYGLSSAQRGTFYKQHKNKIKSLVKAEAIEFIKFFWDKPSFDERCVAIGIINDHKEKLTLEDMNLIEQLMREANGWAFLDSLIIPIMPHILKQDSKAYAYLTKWIADDDYWVRRSALLAQLLFFRDGFGGNKQLFFELAKSQFDESWIDKAYASIEDRKRARFFIRKATGWTLREISQKDPESVVDFLNNNKHEMSGLSYREGARKLPDEYKKRLKVSS